MAEHIEGLDGVINRMRQLSNPRKQKNAATRSARKAMAVVRKAAIANAKALDDSKSPERIWKNIQVKASKTKQGFVLMKVGVRGGAMSYANTTANRRANRVGETYATAGSKENPGGYTWYWRYHEYGTSKMPARPFMRPALNNNIDSVQDGFVTDFKDQLDKEIAR